ncbi:hypothetical protein BJ508DRAFT_315541 [Ascobolus immersus RN42]|uniref:Uncharacterized protein n=1 Tax=Ascobolus immersus RN42 TaxID=1160509 RepID=A0A3N4HAB1_ASCIM|nr:hypothetical protein BJ508DRAFT_315541 [Ascobolus immersus RN42]
MIAASVKDAYAEQDYSTLIQRSSFLAASDISVLSADPPPQQRQRQGPEFSFDPSAYEIEDRTSFAVDQFAEGFAQPESEAQHGFYSSSLFFATIAFFTDPTAFIISLAFTLPCMLSSCGAGLARSAGVGPGESPWKYALSQRIPSTSKKTLPQSEKIALMSEPLPSQLEGMPPSEGCSCWRTCLIEVFADKKSNALARVIWNVFTMERLKAGEDVFPWCMEQLALLRCTGLVEPSQQLQTFYNCFGKPLQEVFPTPEGFPKSNYLSALLAKTQSYKDRIAAERVSMQALQTQVADQSKQLSDLLAALKQQLSLAMSSLPATTVASAAFGPTISLPAGFPAILQ